MLCRAPLPFLGTPCSSHRPSTVRLPRSLALLLGGWLLVAASGCSGGAEPVDGAWTTVADGWSDAGEANTAVDAGSADVSAADTGAAATDAGLSVDAGLTDMGVAEDTGPGDTGPADTSPGDTGPGDTGPGDTGPGDTSTPPKDTGGGVCADKSSAYIKAKEKALKCTSDFQCYAPTAVVDGKGFVFGAPDIIGCGCNRYYSDVGMAGQSLADLNSEFVKAGCKAACPKIACKPLDTQIGMCKAGNCLTTEATCKNMETLVAGAVDAGRACKVDTDCSNFGMQGSIPCGCPVNVNLTKLAPGKPLFLYITMVTRAYNNLGCAKNVQCACAPIGKGACVKGMCVTK